MRVGSLFSGYGGLDMAVERYFGATTAWHVEFDKHPSTVLAQRWPGVPNYGDVTAVDWSAVEPVDIITGGYPCQPFSHAGQRRGTNDDRHLWPYMLDAIRVLRPRVVVAENVAGHLTLGFDTVLADLAAVGFDADWGVVSAAEAGAPHRRERLFIVATDASHDGLARRGPARPGRAGLADSGDDGTDLTLLPTPTSRDHKGRNQRDDTTCLPGAVAADFGPYTAAIARWEQVLGRPAPSPTEPGANDRPRLSPRFVEFMMGLPAGHVTDTGIPRNAQLKALGNGVVPQQAALALSMLLPRLYGGVGRRQHMTDPRTRPAALSCAAPDCSRASRARGYCDTHYRRVRKWGDPTIVLKPWGTDDLEVIR